MACSGSLQSGLPVLKGFLGCIVLAACGSASPITSDACQAYRHAGADYIVCKYNTRKDDIRFFHSDAEDRPYLQFDVLARELSEQGLTLSFAMNGGMYHDDRSPVGFYRDPLGDRAQVNTNDGPGNFHLKPNGVFWLMGDRAGISESQAYLASDLDPVYATQSGPMLVLNGQLHPGLNPEGTSRRRRNGVGVDAIGEEVYFVISDDAVSFHDFATLFRDALETPDALYLDGQVSRLYAPALRRNEAGADLGPIVGVVD